MRRFLPGLWALLGCVAGCDRGERATASSAQHTASTPTAQQATAAPDGAASNLDAGTPSTRRWRGTYKVAAGSLYVPEEWKVRWRPDDATSGVGEGPLALTVDPEVGVVRGTLEGALGPARIDGYLADGGLSATIKRRDPHDQGFTGVLVGRESAGRIEGTLNASPATAGAVRAGTFSLSPAAGGEP